MERSEFVKQERELQAELRKKSLPIIERRLSVDDLSGIELSEKKKLEALQDKLEREGRRRMLMNAAAKNSQWIVFSNQELFDESDLEILADFTHKLKNKVPSSFWEDQQNLQYSEKLGDTIDVSRDNSSSSVIISSRENSAKNLVKLDKVKVKIGDEGLVAGDRQNYKLPAGYINEKVATDVIELYRQGGRLHKVSVHKLLRYAYKKLKDLPNTIHLMINQSKLPFSAKATDEKVTIVGDLHGKSQLFI